MYESFFGLTRRPFSATPDPDCLVAVETMQNAFEELSRTVRSGQVVGILSAPAGTGKTLLCRRLAEEFQDSFSTAFLPNSNFSTTRSLLQAVLYELGHPYIRMAEQELRLELVTAARSCLHQQKPIVLLIDEAHLLSERLLEEVRSITNLADEASPMVRVLLFGQLSLEEKLASPAMAALNQRIHCQCTLDMLTRSESVDYIACRLNWAQGLAEEIFSPQAMQLISQVSDGLPRCLNQLCDHSLLLAYAAGEKPVSASIVREALEDLRQLPLHWNEPMETASPLDQLTQQACDAQSLTAIEASPESTPSDFSDLETKAVEFGSSETIEFGAPDDASESLNSQNLDIQCATEAEVEVEVEVETNESAREEIDLGEPDANEWIPIKETHEDWDIPFDRCRASDASLKAGETSETIKITNNGFEEEEIVDRYATLDAGRMVSAGDIFPAEDEETSDELQHLPLHTELDEPSKLVEDRESKIGSAVLATVKKTQQLLDQPVEGSNTYDLKAPEETLESNSAPTDPERPSSSRFNVIQADIDDGECETLTINGSMASEPSPLAPASNGSRKPPQKFQRLFSELRRRQQRPA